MTINNHTGKMVGMGSCIITFSPSLLNNVSLRDPMLLRWLRMNGGFAQPANPPDGFQSPVISMLGTEGMITNIDIGLIRGTDAFFLW